MAVGSATDSYMRHEERLKLTQGMLQLFLKYRFPVFISTKSTLILRDLELLKEIDKHAILPVDLKPVLRHGVILSVSVSTMNDAFSNILEPGAATPPERLKLIQRLKQEGFLAGVNAIPILPFISDTEEELEKLIAAAKSHEADYILVGGLTLFGNEPADSKSLYFKFLKKTAPSLIPEYEKLYRSNFFPPKSYLKKLKEKAEILCKKHKIRNSILEADVKTIQRDPAGTQSKLF